MMAYHGSSPVCAIIGGTTKDGPGGATNAVIRGLTTGKGWL